MDDYISREAAKAAIQKALYDGTGYGEALSAIPAADVRPVVRSQWNDKLVAFYRGCPECGAIVSARTDIVFLKDFPSAIGELNFCPNCGADMGGSP